MGAPGKADEQPGTGNAPRHAEPHTGLSDKQQWAVTWEDVRHGVTKKQ